MLSVQTRHAALGRVRRARCGSGRAPPRQPLGTRILYAPTDSSSPSSASIAGSGETAPSSSAGGWFGGACGAGGGPGGGGIGGAPGGEMRIGPGTGGIGRFGGAID